MIRNKAWYAIAGAFLPSLIHWLRQSGLAGSSNVIGEVVRVNFNRNRSHFGKPRAGESWPGSDDLWYYLYAIRHKVGTSWNIAGYSEDFSIKDAVPKINEAAHYRVQKGEKARTVYSFLQGTAISRDELPDRPPDGFAHYSPFPPGIPSEYFIIPNRVKDLEKFNKRCLDTMKGYPRLESAKFVHFTQGRFDCGIAPILLWDITTKDGKSVKGDGTSYLQAQVILQRQYTTVDRDQYEGPRREWIEPGNY